MPLDSPSIIQRVSRKELIREVMDVRVFGLVGLIGCRSVTSPPGANIAPLKLNSLFFRRDAEDHLFRRTPVCHMYQQLVDAAFAT